MYEVWLFLNILWEIALGILPLLLGAIVAVAAFLLVPGSTRSSLAEMSHWVGWANLVAIAAGFGGVVALFAWPLLAMRAPARGA
jgi:hypothetical protein